MTRKQKRIAELINAAPHMTADDVAKTLRVKTSCVYWLGRRYGIRCKSARKVVGERDRRRIVALAKSRISDEEIGGRVGWSAETVGKVRRRAGIKTRAPAFSSNISRGHQVDLVRQHLCKGKSYSEIAKEAGTTRSTIAGMVYRARKQNWDLSEGVEKEVETV